MSEIEKLIHTVLERTNKHRNKNKLSWSNWCFLTNFIILAYIRDIDTLFTTDRRILLSTKINDYYLFCQTIIFIGY